jgi:hypothetical protein
LQIEPNTTYRKYKESAHMSLLDHTISQPSLDISPTWTPVITAEVKIYNSVKCRLSEKICFLCWYHKEYLFSPVMSSIVIQIVLWCKTPYVQSLKIYVSWISRWFMVCLLGISHLGAGTGVRR